MRKQLPSCVWFRYFGHNGGMERDWRVRLVTMYSDDAVTLAKNLIDARDVLSPIGEIMVFTYGSIPAYHVIKEDVLA